jgi:adenylate kinase family enzyme
LLPYYDSRGLLKTVDGTASPKQVTQSIEATLASS